jgi:hypothetical protein
MRSATKPGSTRKRKRKGKRRRKIKRGNRMRIRIRMRMRKTIRRIENLKTMRKWIMAMKRMMPSDTGDFSI